MTGDTTSRLPRHVCRGARPAEVMPRSCCTGIEALRNSKRDVGAVVLLSRAQKDIASFSSTVQGSSTGSYAAHRPWCKPRSRDATVRS